MIRIPCGGVPQGILRSVLFGNVFSYGILMIDFLSSAAALPHAERKVKSVKISTEEVQKVALLSRLAFDPEELEEMKASMNSILTYMDELNQYDTADVQPMVHAVEQYNVMREDVPHTSFTNEEALMNAPEKENGYFKVPKII